MAALKLDVPGSQVPSSPKKGIKKRNERKASVYGAFGEPEAPVSSGQPVSFGFGANHTTLTPLTTGSGSVRARYERQFVDVSRGFFQGPASGHQAWSRVVVYRSLVSYYLLFWLLFFVPFSR